MSSRVAISFLLILCAVPALAQVGSVSKLGDNELTCRQIYDGVKEMEKIVADDKAKAAESQDAAHSTARNASIGWSLLSMLPIPIPIGAIGAASAAASAANVAVGQSVAGDMKSAVASQMSAAQASARQQYLTSLFNSKGCKLSEIEAKQPQTQKVDQASSAEQVAPAKQAPESQTPGAPIAASEAKQLQAQKIDQASTAEKTTSPPAEKMPEAQVPSTPPAVNGPEAQ